MFHAIAEVTIGATGHAMLFSSDGVPVICPVMSPEEHTVRPELISALGGLKAGWTVAADDSHGGRNALVGFAPVRFSERLAPGSLGGKQWITVVRQDPQETYAPLTELMAKVLLYGLLVFAVLWGTGVLVARRIARPIQLLHDGVREIGSGRLDRRLELKTGDEIEGLADAFNLMATNLQRSFAQIEQRMVDVRRLEEKYRDLIEHSPEMIYQMDRSGQFVHVNKTGLEKLGYQPRRDADDAALGSRAARPGAARVAISRAAGLSRAEHDGNGAARQRRSSDRRGDSCYGAVRSGARRAGAFPCIRARRD